MSKEKLMTLQDIVEKLAGPITPVGETQTDNERFDNLRKTTELVGQLITEICHVATQKNRHEFSIGRAGKYASNFLRDILEDTALEKVATGQ